MSFELPPKSPQEHLREQLLSQSITPQSFLDELKQLDQSTPDRTAAIHNLNLLLDEDVRKIFINNPKSESAYNVFLAFTYFHVGQIVVFEGKGDPLEYFKKSLETDNDSEKRDREYLQATIAYFEGNISLLEKIYPEMEEGINKKIVERLLSGLLTHKTVDYKRDYVA